MLLVIVIIFFGQPQQKGWNLLTFCLLLPLERRRVNAESYVIIKIILRDCVDFFGRFWRESSGDLRVGSL